MANHDDPTTVLPPMSTDLDSLPSSSWSASSSSSSSLCSSSSSSSSFFFPQVLHAPQVLRYVHHTFQGAGLPIFSSSSSSFSLSRVAGTSSCKGRERGVEEEEEEEEGSWRTWRGQEEVPGPTQGFMEWGHRLTLELNHFDAYVRSHLEVPPHLQSTVWKRVQTCLRASPLSSTLPHVNVVLQPSLLYGCPPFVPLPRNKSKTKWIHEPCVHLTLLPLNPPSSSLPHPHRWVSVTIDLFKPFVRSLAPLSHLSPFIYTPPPSSTSSSSSSSLSSDLPVLLFIDAETNVPVCLHWTFLEAQEQRPRAALFFSSVTGTLENDDDHEKNDGQEQKPENDPPSPGQEGGKEERPTSSTPLTVLLRYLSWVTCFFDLPVSLTQWHTLLQWVLGPEPRDTAPTLPPPSSHRPFLPLQPGHGLLAVLWFYGWTLHDAAVLAQNPVDEKRDEGWSTQPSTTSSSFLTPEDPSSPSSLSLQHQYAHHVWQWYQTSHVVPPYSVLRKLCQFLFYQCHAPNASTLLLERTLDMDWVQRYLEKEMKDMKKFKKKP